LKASGQDVSALERHVENLNMLADGVAQNPENKARIDLYEQAAKGTNELLGLTQDPDVSLARTDNQVGEAATKMSQAGKAVLANDTQTNWTNYREAEKEYKTQVKAAQDAQKDAPAPAATSTANSSTTEQKTTRRRAEPTAPNSKKETRSAYANYFFKNNFLTTSEVCFSFSLFARARFGMASANFY